MEFGSPSGLFRDLGSKSSPGLSAACTLPPAPLCGQVSFCGHSVQNSRYPRVAHLLSPVFTEARAGLSSLQLLPSHLKPQGAFHWGDQVDHWCLAGLARGPENLRALALLPWGSKHCFLPSSLILGAVESPSVAKTLPVGACDTAEKKGMWFWSET